ncbi:hypothetical protein [Nonomuraea sediminis]|uniref:hypothetical protein n=1 Tax=Nonomuraea sediminis TaxID=2835864 RepID=UPI001BDCB7C5|nr:hypothetical protein [Nonomuraea sediminis]
MPKVVSAARFIVTLQVAFAIVALLISGSLMLAGGIDWLPALILSGGIALTVALGLVMGRFDTRRRLIRWSMIALQVVAATAYLGPMVADSSVRILRLLSPNALLPAAVIVLLLLPAAGRWFDR